jgi:hypothetical protein
MYVAAVIPLRCTHAHAHACAVSSMLSVCLFADCALCSLCLSVFLTVPLCRSPHKFDVVVQQSHAGTCLCIAERHHGSRVGRGAISLLWIVADCCGFPLVPFLSLRATRLQACIS